MAGDCGLALSVDGTILCSAHHDKLVVWDVESRRPRKIIHTDSVQHGGRTHGLAISPDSQLVASKAFDHAVHVWNIETGEPVLSPRDAHTNAVISVQFSPDGSQIVTGGADGTARLWDASTGDHQRIVGKSSGWIRYVEFFADGQQVAIGAETRVSGALGFQGEVQVCSISTGEVVHHFPTDARVMCGDISPDSQRVAVSTGLGSMGAFGAAESAEVRIRVWDLKSGSKINDWSTGDNRIQQIAFGADGNQLWTISQDSALRQWDVRSGEELPSVNLASEQENGRFPEFAFAPDMTFMVAGGLRQINRESSLGVLEMKLTSGGQQKWNKTLSDRWPAVLTMSRDGRVVAGYLRALGRSQADGRIIFYSTDDGRELHTIDIDDGSIRSMAFSPDGKRLATGMDRGHTLVWDVSAYTAD
jgi:WD40 repeat protein